MNSSVLHKTTLFLQKRSIMSSPGLSPTTNNMTSATMKIVEEGAGESNCSSCLNDLCIDPSEYQVYEQAVAVDTYEMILIAVHFVIFMCGFLGNILVSHHISDLPKIGAVFV